MNKDYRSEKKEATILFCDIRNFTYLFESVDPLKAVQFANSVLAKLGQEVEEVGGTVDRFTGDGFMAHFGVEHQTENHALDACRAALLIEKALREINNKRYYNVEEVVSAGTGIHTGEVAVGEIKTPQINQKTVLGDVVNTTSRIEELTKYFSVDTLISESTHQRVRDEFQFKKMSSKKLRGKNKQVTTYWLLPMNQI